MKDPFNEEPDISTPLFILIAVLVLMFSIYGSRYYILYGDERPNVEYDAK